MFLYFLFFGTFYRCYKPGHIRIGYVGILIGILVKLLVCCIYQALQVARMLSNSNLQYCRRLKRKVYYDACCILTYSSKESRLSGTYSSRPGCDSLDRRAAVRQETAPTPSPCPGTCSVHRRPHTVCRTSQRSTRWAGGWCTQSYDPEKQVFSVARRMSYMMSCRGR